MKKLMLALAFALSCGILSAEAQVRVVVATTPVRVVLRRPIHTVIVRPPIVARPVVVRRAVVVRPALVAARPVVRRRVIVYR